MKISRRRQEIIDGINVTPEKRKQYLANWERMEKQPRPAKKAKCQPNQFYAKGPGTFLHESLDSIGLKDDGKCGCKAKAKKMNAWGPDGCEKNLDVIVGWLGEEAKRRGLPFMDFPARMLVKRCIDLSRKTEIRPDNATPDTPPSLFAAFLLENPTPAFPAGWETWPNAIEGKAMAEHERKVADQTS